jgi:parvulin-like peptidyl-prolyl isomerase
MKKLLNKIRRRKQPSALQNESASALRITNETVAEHRERILAGGRKFKYPLQYPKYRIVVITLGIVIALLAILSGLTAWRLYGAQDTSKVMLHVTQILPLPVGSVDGQMVRYSDYLSELTSALHYLSTKEAVNFSSDDGKRQLEYQKRLALNKAIENAYATQIAKRKNITISNKELDDFIQKEIKGNNLGVTEDMYKQVIKDYYDWSFDDYRDSVRMQLLKKKVIASVDIASRQEIEALRQSVASGKDFAEVAKQSSEDPLSKINGGDVGFINAATDDPNNFVAAVGQLQSGKVSDIIEGVDGFYLLKLIEKRGSDLHVAKIVVTYKTFAVQLDALKKAGKVKEYITIADTARPTNR